MFNRNRLSAAIVTVLASAAGSSQVFAQDAQPVEEVIVTGIRASLERSMDIKRDSAGVVDAITAEDIGKFPDTNLAESLQRITGVSIDRTNGEGSRITVRGFGPDFNMVTLNGRTLPVGSAYGGSSGADASTRGGASRAFDFANLASEAVSGVQVYKTGKAGITTGGIGATVNILTSRPLDNPGFTATAGVKAVMDTTNRTGDDVTPELSGLVSWTDDDEKFGVSLSASFQERHSGYTGATVNDWQIGTWGSPDEDDKIYDQGDYDAVVGPGRDRAGEQLFENKPEDGQLYARPFDIRHAFSDQERTRTNAQLTFQFAPTDDVKATLDYTFAEKDIEEHRGELTNWVQNGSNVTHVVFDDSAVATPTLVSEQYGDWDDQAEVWNPATFDVGMSQQYRGQEDTLDSVGLNVEWAVNDELTLIFDMHDSSLESLPTGPGNSGELDIGLGAPVKTAKTLYYGSGLPTWEHTINDSESVAPGANANGVLDAGDISSTVMRVWSAEQTSDVTQFKADGIWEFDEGRFDFGVERREMSSNTTTYNGTQNQVLGGWGASNPGEFPEGLIQPFNITGEFDDYNTGVTPAAGFRADARELGEFLVEEYSGEPFYAYIGVENTDQPGTVRNTKSSDTIEEDTTAAYFQFSMDGQLGDFDVGILAGLRYEETDQTSISDTPPVDYIVWESDNDFRNVFPQGVDATISTNDYDALLPNLDVNVNFTDDIIGRFSFSKTIARPSLDDLTSAVTGFTIGGSTLLSAIPSADSSNPYLVPLESTNFDLSFEWYYDDASFASVGFWEKRVINFVGTEQVNRTFGIPDITGGPLAESARDALEDGDFDVDVGNLYTMMMILDNPDVFPGGAAEFTGDTEQQQELGEDCNEANDSWCNIYPSEDDPEVVFRTSNPINNQEAKIYGMELGVQHFFGDTGFGVMANYTIVNGDIKFNDLADPDENQFALLGLSDTANLVLMYENYGVQARLAYNWRDKFLNRTGLGVSNNPGYIEAYSQIDMNVSYAVTDEIDIFAEGINLTGEDRREHARNKNMMWGMEDLGARYQIGARYTF